MLVKEQTREVMTRAGIQRKVSHLRNVRDVLACLSYLEDPQHVHHTGKEVIPTKFAGRKNLTRSEFLAILEQVATVKGRRSGRKRKWLAKVYIASTEGRKQPMKNTDGDASPVLDETERDYYARRFVEEAGFAFSAYAWHVDRETGRCDCHFVVINCDLNDYTCALKSWKASIIRRRIASDRIEAELNQQRRTHGQVLLTSMPERQKQIKSAKRIENLADQVARVGQGNVATDALRGLIESLGHSVTRQNSRTISVLHPGRKKARRYSVAKLMAEIEQSRKAQFQPRLVVESTSNGVEGSTAAPDPISGVAPEQYSPPVR